MPPFVKVGDGVFASKNFFLVQRLPSRSSYVERVENNGGRVVKLESQADYIVADHLRPDAPPGSLSYKFIDKALNDGLLPDEGEFSTGRQRGSARPGGLAAPSKSTRTPFTAADDRMLYQWVRDAEAQGYQSKGNELYKQLAAENPRHTFHSWRDRYIKYLSVNPPRDLAETPADTLNEPEQPRAPQPRPPAPRQATTRPVIRRPVATSTTLRTTENATSIPEPRPPPPRGSTQQRAAGAAAPRDATSYAARAPSRATVPVRRIVAERETPRKHRMPEYEPDPEPSPDEPAESAHDERAETETGRTGFEDEDIDDWVKGAAIIQEILVKDYNRAWRAFAEKWPHHTAQEWKGFYEDVVVPIYEERSEHEGASEIRGGARYRDITKIFGTPEQLKHASQKMSATNGAMTELEKVSSTSTSHPRGTPKVNSEQVSSAPVQKTDSLATKRKRSPSQTTSERVKRPRARTGADALDTATEESTILEPARVDDAQASNEESATLEVDAVQMQILGEYERSQQVALTEANLAQAQAEHEPQSTRRAVDLTQDREDQDQTPFASYLETLVKIGPESKHSPTVDLKVEGLKQQAAENEDATEESFADTSFVDAAEVVDEVEELPSKHATSAGMTIGGGPSAVPHRDPDLSSIPAHSDADSNHSDMAFDDSVQLELAEPAGGWQFSSQSPQAQPATIAAVLDSGRSKDRAHAFNTQDIYDAVETQALDLDVPDYETQHDMDEQHGLDSQALNESNIEQFFEDMLADGHNLEDIRLALKVTSARAQLAEVVLASIREGQGIPEDIAGIWTEDEDAAAEGGDASKLRYLDQKHGWDEVQNRRLFLEDLR